MAKGCYRKLNYTAEKLRRHRIRRLWVANQVRENGGHVRCHYCPKMMTLRQATVDHYVPLSLGGPDRSMNWVVACKGCNSAKADMHPHDFKLMSQYSEYAGV